MDMIERVARAICKERYWNGGDESDDGWEDCPGGIKADYLKEARAAIEAMREPSHDMIRNVSTNVWFAQDAGDDTTIREIYHQMIDAALSPSPQQQEMK